MNIVGIFLMLHAFNRWLLTLAGLAALVKFGLGMAQKSAYDALAKRLLLAFSILLDVQWLLGLIVLLGKGFGDEGWPRFRFEHAGVMTLAVILVHLPAGLGKNWSDAEKYRNGLLIIIGVLVLTVVGVLSIPGVGLLP